MREIESERENECKRERGGGWRMRERKSVSGRENERECKR